VLIGHSDSVAGAALAADGGSALTFAFDASARVWDLASGRCRAVLLPLANEQVLAAWTLLQGATCVETGEGIALLHSHASATHDHPRRRVVQQAVLSV